MKQIFIISDGTGGTAKQLLKAALVQFEKTKIQLNVRHHVRTEEEVLQIINEALAVRGSIVHTVVSQKLRDKILHFGRLHDVETIDLMGPLLAQLSHQFAYSPSERPGIFHELNKSYFQRIEALEFAFRHDDGQKIEELNKAEIVLLGVSRTFKTPLSIYFAFKGWLVANIPIILGIKLPDIVFELPPERVFCLTTSPHRLAVLRSVRAKHLGGGTGYYADLNYVQRELKYAYEIFNKQPKWSVVDVTNKPIEEIAFEIVNIIKK
jgi:regulator of PEP synthase PpsR (kinase-PPPase family)